MLLRGSTVRDGMRGHSRRLHPSIWLLGLTRSSENLGLLLMPHAGCVWLHVRMGVALSRYGIQRPLQKRALRASARTV